MRLISQNGLLDVSYELCSIYVDDFEEFEGEYCIFYDGVSDRISGFLASYSSKAKALKVMEMVRDCYLGKECGYHTEHGVCYHSRNDFETKVFKFPADEEVEV